jgi:hypothetical protein
MYDDCVRLLHDKNRRDFLSNLEISLSILESFTATGVGSGF